MTFPKGKKNSRITLSIFILLMAVAIPFGRPILSATQSRFEKLELFNKVLFLIESQYYRQVDTEKLIVGAINGMMQTLDPHSAFLDKEQFSKMQEDTKGEFAGLGIEVTQKDGIIVIMTVIDDTPAFRAGLHA
ncbi:MAG: peptidase S41, partial [Pseudomonadota bacterium]